MLFIIYFYSIFGLIFRSKSHTSFKMLSHDIILSSANLLSFDFTFYQ